MVLVYLLQKLALKALILHSGNKFSSVPITHTAERKVTYQNMKALLEKIQHEK
jgi:hypothetical protein